MAHDVLSDNSSAAHGVERLDSTTRHSCQIQR